MATLTSSAVRQDLSLRTAPVVVVDDRPLLRAALRAVLAVEGAEDELIDGPLADAIDLLETHRPQVMVVPLRGDDAAPFRTVATAKALRDDLHVLVLADEVTPSAMREAVVAGADSLLLTTATLEDIRRAVQVTARGQRVISPEVAVHLVGFGRPDAVAPRPASLTPRELDVLRLMAEGLTNHEVAERLHLSPRTIKTHVQNLLGKLDVPDRTSAVARGFRLGLLR